MTPRLFAIATLLFLLTSAASAQISPPFSLIGGQLQKRTNDVLALMGYSQTPDVTSGALSIKNGTTGNPDFDNTSIGGGFTLSESFPLYLEGTAGSARYDPKFVVSNGTVERDLPTRWNSAIATAGIGWDFHLSDDWVIRPILNGSIGRVASDVAIGSRVVSNRTDFDIDFLQQGTLKANGLGGSLMFDYQHYVQTHAVDVELRYTNIYLKSYGGATPAVKGSARNENASLWARWRAPTGMVALDRPVRYILELAHTSYFGQDADVVGINHLTSLGTGLELDTSKYHPLWIYRARAVVRYVFGQNVHGFSLGLAVTFD